MKILYVCGLSEGLRDLILEGRDEARGMPAFVYPLRTLLERGHEVSLVVVTRGPRTNSDLRIGVDWLRGCRVRFLRAGGAMASLVLPYFELRALVRSEAWDFVYGHGSVGTLGCLAARANGVRCGMRLYGVLRMAREVERLPKVAVLVKHPLYYLAFTCPKALMIVTDDGSRGDLVHKALCRRAPWTFHHWVNGVERITADPLALRTVRERYLDGWEGPFLTYTARIDRIKQQHLALEILAAVLRQDSRVRLFLIGQVSDPSYAQELQAAARRGGIAEHVRFLGAVPRSAHLLLSRQAVATLSLNAHSNRGNTVIEALANGCVVLCPQDGTTDEWLEAGRRGLVFDGVEAAAEAVCRLLANPALGRAIGREAEIWAADRFPGWDTRALREVELLENAAGA